MLAFTGGSSVVFNSIAVIYEVCSLMFVFLWALYRPCSHV